RLQPRQQKRVGVLEVGRPLQAPGRRVGQLRPGRPRLGPEDDHKMLRNPAYVGVFLWNQTRREYDADKERWVTLKNPRSQWEVYHTPELALVPVAVWRAARKRLSPVRGASPLTGRQPSRNQKSATTLFSGTLFCGYCGEELKLIRSAGKY